MARVNVVLLRDALERAQFHDLDLTRIAVRRADRDLGWVYAWGIEGHVVMAAHRDALWHWQADPDEEGCEFAVLVTVDGSRKKPGRSASHVARKLLGLDVAQAERLFGAETADVLWGVVAELMQLPLGEVGD